jgi:peptidoglycan/xylan/chitin deacetylase (PgdA/CDA1 family)
VTSWTRLRGHGPADHVALTFDDGPDRVSTPLFLDLLASHRVTATFFLLGQYAVGEPGLVRRMHDAGHELAVHGWDHRCLAFRRPGQLHGELVQTLELLERLSGVRPVRYRPPYGVLTPEALVACRRLSLQPVLWSAWGRDWTRRATPASVVRTLDRGRVRGGTVLLHDTDRTSAPDSWRRTLAATELLLERWQREGVSVGPLAEH